ncbi:virus Gp157 [Granulicatella balaenopterae]|uniref:Virus Gp157 n=1 Tax=Granulicatella balaenopterae TaxID=137733 RepID=A0A1H9IPJ7_9LACT|nr:siphovirus Gp157 family protein [Granulicatella balaenopterae]SEQ76476.1 virus Gp157 [Granulicatella balaenopterae]
MNLYELSNNYNQLAQLIEENSDAVENDVLIDTLDAIETTMEDKAENIAKLVQSLKAEEEGIKAEVKRLNDKKKVITNKQANLKSYLQDVMQQTGKTKFKSGTFSFAIQKNPPKAVIDDLSLLPFEVLVVQPPTPDLNIIKGMLKAGEEVPGAHLEQGESLRIR